MYADPVAELLDTAADLVGRLLADQEPPVVSELALQGREVALDGGIVMVVTAAARAADDTPLPKAALIAAGGLVRPAIRVVPWV